MPRTLPWLANPAPADRKPKAAATVKRRKVEPSPPSSPPDVLDEFIRTPKTVADHKTNAQVPHSPSTSPPPAPPKQEFMRPGWDNDDAWRMVTDEFMSTAQLFTAHLAHAEYRRQKTMARKREAALGGADAIARPVVGQLSKDGQRKKQGELHRAGVKAILKGEHSEEEEEEEEDPWAGTQIASLMMSPRKRDTLQPKAAVGRSSTRAAAGFNPARPLDLRGRPIIREKTPDIKKGIKVEANQDSTDDDLDAPALPRSLSRPPRQSRPSPPTPSRPKSDIFKPFATPTAAKKSSHRPPSSTTRSSDLSSGRSRTKCASIDREISRPAPKRTKRESSPPVIKLEPDFGFPSIPQPSQTGSSALARRREARLKCEKEEERKIETESQAYDVDELPTFLF
ncbi:hypothetical protein D6D12_04273 [Aureobasidium pullulans]|uniref:Uncharacterized protein n=1 Tax=Aureobasidium pullulans TaxID=5580 RepID=A0AB74JWC4_AURPU|nr:hypothetical protein D6D12_04273 [Aureobasidium pullulans]THX50605.1 hypothetical protein D6D11_05296 [Aureobasidium pullulans]